MSIIKITDLELTGKRVLIRSDFNVPIKEGEIINDTRIRSALPTIKLALKKGANVMVTSHLGSPAEGEYDQKFSLSPIVKFLKKELFIPVRLSQYYLDGIDILEGELVVLENVRFNKGEKENDMTLSKKYASLCDIFVMDAFATAHRAHSSTYGVGMFANISCAGLLLSKELDALSKALREPARPMIAVIGGSKVSTKLSVLDSLSKIVDELIVGGGIANTFIAAKGFNVGKSLYESELIDEAKRLLEIETCNILIPSDVYVATEYSVNATANLKLVNDIKENEKIMDLGFDFCTKLSGKLKNAKTILWNGPVGVFEFPNFSTGTKIIANSIANSKAFSIAGGGDTISAIDKFNVRHKISYISTGGGSFLKFVEGQTLPAVLALEAHAKKQPI